MTKEQHLQILMVLSALESWGYSEKHYLPDFLAERLGDAIEALRLEVLK